ncbi:uncharacterized protein N7511_000166 [Penicillium nucicola]|uniref:uncharacterized protein n=1 Tax=Penicillium nucicola TaxID=1850975 RepID=UPI002545B49D|nr:uncharacterized protein N7511_000166 [Penicillium nucicola]KAJ5775155.1 hypothetical protein N7511_000166 [Penicillium nucicola]
MDAIEQSAPNALAHLTQVPIAQLSPDLAQPSEKFIVAVVTLIWPYSSSNKSLSLLLAEPDARLRRPNGQVKATFHGRVAQEIAESHVGIRDTVHLSLANSRFVSHEAVTQTPGRSAVWDAHFEDAVLLEPTVPTPVDFAPPSTPVRQTAKHGLDTAPDTGSWGSPAFMRSTWSSYGGVIDTSRDLFTEDDGFVPGKGRKRPRYSLQREDWRLIDESESSVDKEVPVDWWEQTVNQELDAEDTEDANGQPSDEPMANAAPPFNSENAPQKPLPVFAKPSLELTDTILERRAAESSNKDTQTSVYVPGPGPLGVHLPTDTPQIRPIPSPGLPIPSPLVSNHANSNGYFTSWSTPTQLDEIRPISPETTIIGSPHESAIETPAIHKINVTDETPVIESLNPSVMAPVESTVASLQTEPALDTESLLHGIVVLPNESEDLPNEFKAGTADPPSIIDEPSIAQGDVEIGKADEAEKSNQDHPNELLSLEDRDSQLGDGDIQHDVQAAQPEREIDNEEDSVSDLENEVQSSGQPHSLSAVDADKMDGIEPTANPPEDLESVDEVDGSIEALNVPPRPRSENYDEEEDAVVGGEEQYDEEADDYESQYNYDDEEDHHVPHLGTRPEQEEFSDDESDVENSTDDGSEQEQTFPSRPETQEVIVLDSDSEDETAPTHPALSTFQVSDEDDRSQSPGSDQYVQRDVDRAESDEESSNSDQNEKIDERNTYKSDDQDDRVHDSDKASESPLDTMSGDEDAPENEQDMASVDLVQDDILLAELEYNEQDEDSDSIASVESQVGPVAAQDSDEDQQPDVEEPAHNHPSVSEVSEAIDHGISVDQENLEDSVVLTDTDKIDTFFNVDGPSDSHVSPSLEEDAAESVLAQEQPIELPEITDLDTKIEPVAPGVMASLSGQQLPTPDPTQQSALSDQRGEPKVSPTGEQDEPMELDRGFPYMRAAGSLHPESIEAVPEPENVHDVQKEKYGLDGATEHPDDRRPLEVVVSTEAPEMAKELATEPPLPNPNRNATGLRSKYSYFAPLATLIDHYNALVDTISIVNEVSPIAKAKTGSKDWFMTIQLTDPSMAGTTLQAQIFRRYKSTFPSLVEGNAVLLRDFKVRSFNHAVMIVSAETSAWAVFDGSSQEAQIKGPPVEYGPEETKYAADLRRWYTDMGLAHVADHQLQASIERESIDREMSVTSQPLSESGSPDSTRSSRRSRRGRQSGRVTIHSLRDGTRYIEVGSPNSRGSDSIHELRDGTVYSNP